MVTKTISKNFSVRIFPLVALLTMTIAQAQEISPDDNLLEKFKSQSTTTEKFNFFFNTPNRYIENSAYDWLDNVNAHLENARTSGDSTTTQQFQIIKGYIYKDLGQYDKSIATVNEVYVGIEKLTTDHQKVLFNLLDNDYSQLRLYEKQIEIRKEQEKRGLLDEIYFYDIFSNLGQYKKARNDYILVVGDIDKDDTYAMAVYHNNIGNYQRLDNSPSVALTQYKVAKGQIDIFLNNIDVVKTEKELIEGNHLRGLIDGNIGKAYKQQKQFKEAVPWLESSITTIKEYYARRYSQDIIENTLALADSYLQLKNFEMAKDYLDKDLEPLKIENIILKNKLLAAYYDRTGDFENAASFLKLNAKIQDSLAVNESVIRKQQVTAVFQKEIENTASILDAQRVELEKSRDEMQAKDERINLVFISLVFTLMGFAGLVYAYLRSIKTQRLIADQKRIIESALVEKDSLLKEIHHRVKNNLQMVSSLLSLQTKNTRSKAAIQALEEGKTRVKAMALIHQKLYQNEDLSVIEMQGYIESLINSVQSVYKKGGHNINITIDAEGTELDIDRAIPFGLILNELVSNSFKYAFTDDDENAKIYIHLRKNGDKGFFEYTDNGIGLPEDTNERANSSMGIRLMNRLVNQLQSTLNIDKTTEGVRFWFNFK